MQPIRSGHPGGTIVVISGDLARYTGFYLSLQNLKVPHGSSWQWIRGNGIAANRNIGVRESAGDWVWFIDDDHTFEPDVLLRLLDRKVEIIQPMVATRKPPYHPYVYKREGKEFITPSWDEVPVTGISAWDAVGSGGMLIRRTVLDALKDPWFEEGKIVSDSLGEDLYFCVKAQELGFKIHTDSDVRMGHLTTAEVWPSHNKEGQWAIDLDMNHGVRIRVSTETGKSPTD